MPLYLLDAELDENDPVDRWITARLYEGNPHTRLGQYGLLGIGSVRTLRALGIDPGVLHFNEGHPALAALELAAEAVAAGESLDDALAAARERCVFTTHTPVAAGNESYEPGSFLEAFADVPARLGMDDGRFLDLCRAEPGTDEWPGMTPLALRMSRRANAVSLRHEQVAREMWRPLFHATSGGRGADHPRDERRPPADLPGAAAPGAARPPSRRRMGRAGGRRRRRGLPVDDIPDEELWAARNDARRQLVEYVKAKSVQDRLLRGEDPESVKAVAETFAEDTLTLGFARRIATYKRLFLLTYDPERVRRIFADGPPVQMVVAGKAHPLDENAKQMLVDVFGLSQAVGLTSRVAFLENYDLSVAAPIVGGCDVWLNVPRPPLEASGTSGMKSAANGGLNLSVLDGWWWEGYESGEGGANGWEIDGAALEGEDAAAQDARHAHALYDLLEQQVVPLFYDRGDDGIPHGWLAMVKRSLRTNGPRFSAARMVEDYASSIYPPFRKARFRSSGTPPRAPTPSAGRNPEGVDCRRRDLRGGKPRRRSGQQRDEAREQREQRDADPQHRVERAGHVADGAEHERREGGDGVAEPEHHRDERRDPPAALRQVERERHHEREHPALRDPGEQRPEVRGARKHDQRGRPEREHDSRTRAATAAVRPGGRRARAGRTRRGSP